MFFEQLNNFIFWRTPDYSLLKIPEQEKAQIKKVENQQEAKSEEKIQTKEPKLKRQVRATEAVSSVENDMFSDMDPYDLCP